MKMCPAIVIQKLASGNEYLERMLTRAISQKGNGRLDVAASEMKDAALYMSKEYGGQRGVQEAVEFMERWAARTMRRAYQRWLREEIGESNIQTNGVRARESAGKRELDVRGVGATS